MRLQIFENLIYKLAFLPLVAAPRQDIYDNSYRAIYKAPSYPIQEFTCASNWLNQYEDIICTPKDIDSDLYGANKALLPFYNQALQYKQEPQCQAQAELPTAHSTPRRLKASA